MKSTTGSANKPEKRRQAPSASRTETTARRGECARRILLPSDASAPGHNLHASFPFLAGIVCANTHPTSLSLQFPTFAKTKNSATRAASRSGIGTPSADSAPRSCASGEFFMLYKSQCKAARPLFSETLYLSHLLDDAFPMCE